MRRRTSDWTVLAAGPSLEHASVEDVLKGRVIACNRAVLFHEFKPDIFAANDAPERPLKDMDLNPREVPWCQSHRPRIWSNKAFYETWAEMYPTMDCDYFRHHDDGDWPIMRSTTTQAIAEAFFRGAKRVLVIGQDLCGDRYAIGNGHPLALRRHWDEEIEDVETLKGMGLEILHHDHHSQ